MSDIGKAQVVEIGVIDGQTEFVIVDANNNINVYKSNDLELSDDKLIASGFLNMLSAKEFIKLEYPRVKFKSI